MNNGIGEYLRSRGAVWDDAPGDVLDADTIWKIEQLQTAVLELEGERRFGRSSARSGELEALQKEVQALLEEHGFASYNDYRLCVRRARAATTVGPPPSAPGAWVAAAPVPYVEAEEPGADGDAGGAEPCGEPEGHGPGSALASPGASEALVVLGQVPEDMLAPSGDAAVARAEELALALRREFDRQLAERVQQAQR
ncbi:MAG TPA: hypothetical protein VMU14_02045 [Acidimicrobiales bacterium]|nr:hypothetical protein [Acidimicrobiales bacterium]